MDAENEDQKMSPHIYFMTKALELAKEAADKGEVPVGAVLVHEGGIVGRGSNQPIGGCDPTAHAEIVALRSAAKQLGNYRMPGTTLYVTIEPCTMCLGAIIHARVSTVVFGAREPKAGMLESNPSLLSLGHFNHELEVHSGVMETECSEVISRFFAERRAVKAQLKESR